MEINPLLEVKGLFASAAGSRILKGVDLCVAPGEVHAVMGPNGSGKSTLANVLAGNPEYQVDCGDVVFYGRDILGLPPEQRARLGLFLSFQHPVEIPGVRTDHFLRAAFNAIQRGNGDQELDVLKFDRLMTNKVKKVKMETALTKRGLNEGFSGGERKRNEILQMAILEPRLAILDEPDSGLDVDALWSVANAVNGLRSPDKSIIIVTHYERILKHIDPDVVHVLINGRIVRSGSRELAAEIEESGYDGFELAASQGC